jgi:DNA (cytosine-5)-methyltransferase 1
MLAATRELLKISGLPWVIENVPGADMRVDYRLCGCQFGLNVRRVRWFETSWHGFSMMTPCQHEEDGPILSVVGNGTPTPIVESWMKKLGRTPKKADYDAAMGIDWMTRKELSQAIPPAYTEFIGSQLRLHLGNGQTENVVQGK